MFVELIIIVGSTGCLIKGSGTLSAAIWITCIQFQRFSETLEKTLSNGIINVFIFGRWKNLVQRPKNGKLWP